MTKKPKTQPEHDKERQAYGWRYYRGGARVPRSVPAGRFLAHNHIQHTTDMPHGMNGFRCWTLTKPTGLVKCKCGWAGLPHYRVRGLGSGRSVPGNTLSLIKAQQKYEYPTIKQYRDEARRDPRPQASIDEVERFETA
jgi:hypothetical protein